MVDEPEPTEPAAAARRAENIPSVEGQISAIASANAPVIYFDSVPRHAANAHIVAVTVGMIRLVGVDASAVNDTVITAHLRCSIAAAVALRDALIAAIQTAELAGKPAASAAQN